MMTQISPHIATHILLPQWLWRLLLSGKSRR